MSLIKNLTKFSMLFALLAFLAVDVQSQDDKSKRKSPPMEATANVGDVAVTINYSAPSVKGRTIFGDLIQYGKVDRFGANEATTIELSGDVTIEGQDLAAGKYSVFSIPGEDKWTMIFNTVSDQWGNYEYDKEKDALRVEVEAHKLDELVEQMEIKMKEKEGKSWIVFKWENTKVPVAIAAGAAK